MKRNENLTTLKREDFVAFCDNLKGPYPEKSVLKYLNRRFPEHKGDFRTEGLDLSGLDFSGADWWLVNASNTNFSHANLSNTQCMIYVQGSNFSYANMQNMSGLLYAQGASFFRANLSKGSFNHTDVRNSYMRRAILDDADFSGSIFTDADLEGASAINTRFRRAQMLSVNLKNTNLSNARFNGVTFDEKTDCTGSIIFEIYGIKSSDPLFANSLTSRSNIKNFCKQISKKAIDLSNIQGTHLHNSFKYLKDNKKMSESDSEEALSTLWKNYGKKSWIGKNTQEALQYNALHENSKSIETFMLSLKVKSKEWKLRVPKPVLLQEIIGKMPTGIGVHGTAFDLPITSTDKVIGMLTNIYKDKKRPLEQETHAEREKKRRQVIKEDVNSIY